MLSCCEVLVFVQNLFGGLHPFGWGPFLGLKEYENFLGEALEGYVK